MAVHHSADTMYMDIDPDPVVVRHKEADSHSDTAQDID